MDQEDKERMSKKSSVVWTVFPIIATAIAYGIGYLIYRFGNTEQYDARLELAKTFELSWFYLACVLFSLTVGWLNTYPMRYKEAIMMGGNLRANMFIYKLATDKTEEGSAVIMHEEGDIGRYNRANRSLYHFIENCLGFVVSLPICFFTYPLPTFISLCIYVVGRLIHQIGYTLKGFGGHGFGFLLSFLSTLAIQGLLIVACTKTF